MPQTAEGRSPTLRILHVIPSVTPRHGGPTVAVLPMCINLAERGLLVELATTDSGSEGSDRDWQEATGVPIKMFHSRFLRKYGFSPALGKWLRRNARSFDVLHIHGIFTYSSVPAAGAARRAGVPYVLRPAGQLDPWDFDSGSRLKRLFWWLVGKRMCRGAAALHVTSEREDAAVKARVPGARTWLVSHGVEIPPLPTVGEAVQKPVSQILFLSRIHPKKNLEVLLAAVARVRNRGLDVTLTVAGDGEDSYLRAIKSLSAKLGTLDHVHFVGYATGDAKAKLFGSAQMFCLPSFDENFGLAVAEAMAWAVPVIVSTNVGVASLVQRSDAGVVIDPANEETLADAIEGLMTDPQAAREMGMRGRTATESELSWVLIAARIEDIYLSARGD